MTPQPRKYALITGASSGIGCEYARQLAAQGYNLVLVSNQAAQNEAVAAELHAHYAVETIPICLDLATADAADRLFAEVEQRGIEVELLLCNAGVLLFGALTDTDPERIRQIIALHCTTPALLCRYFGAQMRSRKRGAILLMSSSTAWMPYPTIAAYSATKSFLCNFSTALHDELRSDNVRVTGVFPGAVDTPFYTLSAAWRRWLLRLGVMSSTQSVATKALRALQHGRRRCIPGLFTKICVGACRLLPACAIRPVLMIPAVKRLLS